MLNIKAPLNGFLGYGAASINIIKSLNTLGQIISLHPIGNIQLTTNDDMLFHVLLNNRFKLFNVNSPSLTIFHEFAFFDALQSKNEIIGFPFFELDQIDELRKQSISCLDRMFVASHWAKEIIENAGITIPVDVIPLGVDNSIFKPKPRNDSDTYKFFTIGKIEKRKCTELLPRIFAAAFNEDDNVELHIMCDSPLQQIKQQMPHFQQICQNSPLGDKITIHTLKSTDVELAAFIQSMDCGIYMTRAEGWGLPILQTLACDKQIIVTDYSAQTEFCNEENSNLVNITEKEIANDGIWFHGQGGAWAAIEEEQVQQCIAHMRKLYSDRVAQNPKGVETANTFSWKNCAEKIIGHIGNNENGGPA